MNKDKLFWGNLSNIYNRMFEKRKTYRKMYSLMRESVQKEMKVLDVGTASGLVARAIADRTKEVHGIDFSKEMIAKAKELTKEENIYFSVQDSEALEFEDKSFDVVIIANVLHILKKPEITLKEINRVLKDDGLLIAPTFVWKEITLMGRLQKFVMRRRNFPIYSQWDSEEYIAFLKQNGFSCIRKETLKWHFNICYTECKKEQQ